MEAANYFQDLNEYLEDFKAPVPEEIQAQLPLTEFTAEN